MIMIVPTIQMKLVVNHATVVNQNSGQEMPKHLYFKHMSLSSLPLSTCLNFDI